MVQILKKGIKTVGFMELIDIIRTSLIIFSGVSTIFLISSYFVFKLKDRKRIKPHLQEENHFSTIVVVRENELAGKTNLQHKEDDSRFNIINESLDSVKNIPENTNNLQLNKLRYKPVISYYSFNRRDPMYKYKSPALVKDKA